MLYNIHYIMLTEKTKELSSRSVDTNTIYYSTLILIYIYSLRPEAGSAQEIGQIEEPSPSSKCI